MGIVLVVAGLHNKNLASPAPGAVTAAGTVVYITYGGTLVTPAVQFTDRAGKRITAALPKRSQLPALGSSVTVSYRPSDPSRVHELPGAGWKWQFYTGVVVLLVAFAAYLLLARAVIKRRATRGITSQQTTGP